MLKIIDKICGFLTNFTHCRYFFLYFLVSQSIILSFPVPREQENLTTLNQNGSRGVTENEDIIETPDQY